MQGKILVTGAAGFIGSFVAARLLERGDAVLGIDNMSDYYEVSLKEARLARLQNYPAFEFLRADVADRSTMSKLFAEYSIDRVVHLAAQAGVRYSLVNPHACVGANIVGFLNVLEGCRHHDVGHLVFASTSSVYGANTRMPYSPHDSTDHPVSLYAATKKANEVMAHSYSHLYGVPTTGLRFFTVYGPWGRPDMAYFSFARAIMKGEPIDVYNNGEMWRDFTFVDDIAEGVVRALDRPAEPNGDWSGDSPDPASSSAPYRIYNIGNHDSVKLLDMIALLERSLGRRAQMRLLPMQPGDVPFTHADVDDLVEHIGFAPHTPLADGVQRFAEWFLDFYGERPPNGQGDDGSGPA